MLPSSLATAISSFAMRFERFPSSLEIASRTPLESDEELRTPESPSLEGGALRELLRPRREDLGALDAALDGALDGALDVPLDVALDVALDAAALDAAVDDAMALTAAAICDIRLCISDWGGG